MAALVAGAAVVLLAYWLRDPLIPYGRESPGASEYSRDSSVPDNAAGRREDAIRAITSAVTAEQQRLASVATAALESPAEPADAFAYLGKLPVSRDEGVVLMEGGQALAWAGQLRADPSMTVPGTWVTFDEFYVGLHVVAEKGARRSVATSLLHAEPPSDEIAPTLQSRISERHLVDDFRFGPATDTAAGSLITTGDGRPIVRVDATPVPPEQVRFLSAAKARGRGVALLGLLTVLMIAAGWSDRRKLERRVFTLVVAGIAVALIPWNNFSNFSTAFDPAYFYSPLLEPFSANAGSLAMLASLLLLVVIAVIRAGRTRIPPVAAGTASIALVTAGAYAARVLAGGIALPFIGSTATLWLQWQLPLFLLMFASWLAAAWLARIALAHRPLVSLRTAAIIALAAGATSSFFVWNVTTEQRLQLAMRDVAGLERADVETGMLLTRFGQELAAYDSPGTRADLLKRYAVSDLAAAEVQVSLSLWNDSGAPYGTLDLAALRYDPEDLAEAVAAADTAAGPVLIQMIGPAGRQVILVVAHREGGYTAVLASPRTRLVAQDPYAALLGFAQPDQTEPPYVLTLTDLSRRAAAQPGRMTWRRFGTEWHGDQIVETSLGPARAHVEVDIRSWGTRLVRASLILIFNLGFAGILWALGATAEGGFFRWLRSRGSRWLRSYRGRLTLALFTFFVVPAVAFAGWSYQRLRGDDRNVRELLVRETLHAAAGEDPLAPPDEHVNGGTPLFMYTRAVLTSSTDSLLAMIAPPGRMLPPSVHMSIANEGELTAGWQQDISNSSVFWGFRAAATPGRASYVLAAPARSDEILLDRRRRDLTMLVLFATAMGGLAALWLSGIAARLLARDLELSRIEVARAERVLAWGEMARQVAHEIKNPLTPIRLGVQHLRRARADARIDFDRVLDENVTRILSEIDRLDKIARAFSRYGSAPADLPPPEPVNIAAILRDVIGLERMGIGGVSWMLEGSDEPVFAQARTDELRDVLLNVFENARLARARSVAVSLTRDDEHATIRVVDDGSGIASSALPRVFEPHFSTRTTGSGLGLAISRRLLESWGGSMDLESEESRGTTVLITLDVARA